MPFDGRIAWTKGPDPERPGHYIHTGYPGGLSGYYVIVQDVGDGLWGWLLMGNNDLPVQMRNGYESEARAKQMVCHWLKVNPNG